MKIQWHRVRPHWAALLMIIGLIIAGLGIHIKSWILDLVGISIMLFGSFSILHKATSVVDKALKYLEILEDQNKDLSKLMELVRMRSKQENFMRQAAACALKSHLDHALTDLIPKVTSFQQQQNTPLRFNDRDLVERSALELLKLLPSGSVWLGISLISGHNWNEPHLSQFMRESRRRCEKQELSMHRVYVTHTKDLPITKEMIKSDIKKQIQLRHHVIGNGNSTTAPQDISIVWKPGNNHALAGSSFPLSSVPPDDMYFDAVGALAFEVDQQNSLSGVTLYLAGSKEFGQYVDDFVNCWTHATPLC